MTTDTHTHTITEYRFVKHSPNGISVVHQARLEPEFVAATTARVRGRFGGNIVVKSRTTTVTTETTEWVALPTESE